MPRALGSEMCRLGFAQQVRQAYEWPCAGLGTPGYRTSERKLEQGHRSGGAKEEKKEDIHVQGRRVLITQGEFQNLCDLNGEGIFTAQRGPWHNMEKKLVDTHDGDRRIFALTE